MIWGTKVWIQHYGHDTLIHQHTIEHRCALCREMWYEQVRQAVQGPVQLASTTQKSRTSRADEAPEGD